MARIRSIHPAQWTDEKFVAMSPLARLLAIALRNEADDQGVFEWKPTTIKMRLLPNDNVNVEELLDECCYFDATKKFEVDGKFYGAIRNFLKYQKPKYPSISGILPEHLRNYVGSTGAHSGNGSGIDHDQPKVIPEQLPESPRRGRRRVVGEELNPPLKPPPSGEGEGKNQVFVEKDTPAWDAWTRHRGRPAPTTQAKPEGRKQVKTGWWFPSEFPPVDKSAPKAKG